MTEPIYELHPKMLLDAALKYVERGFKVLPLHSIKNNACTCGNTLCKSPGKHPLTVHGAKDASSDSTTVRGWWSEWPWANVGIAMGDNGVIALDVDTRNEGDLTLENIVREHGPLPETATQRTGNGWHYLYEIDEATLSMIRGKLGAGIDIKANGYIVAEPSIHHSGRRYAWDDGLDVLQGFMPAKAPVWLQRLMIEPVANYSTNRLSTLSAQITLPVQLQEAADALEHLDADDYAQWIEAGMALHATALGDAAYDVWTRWAQTSNKYDAALQRSKWHSFGNGKSSVTIKTLFARAQAVGWVNPLSVLSKSAETAKKSEKADFTVQQGGEFAQSFTPPEYVVDSLLLRGYLHGLTGLSNAGKTAIGLSLACSVSIGHAFGPYKVEKSRVLFLAGENPEDVRLRVRGIEKAWSVSRFENITFAFSRFDLDANMSHLEALAAEKGGFGLVIVDSSAAFFSGTDENSNTEMVLHAIKLRRLTELQGRPAVVVLCHPSKYANGHDALMPRGGSAFLNELDANLTAWKDGEVTQLGWNKVRGPSFDFVDIKLDPYLHVGLKTNLGSAVTSIVANAVDAKTTEALQAQVSGEEDALLVAMHKEPKLSLREYALRLGWMTKAGAPYLSKVVRLAHNLEKEKLIRKSRRKYVLTAAGRKAKDEAEKSA